MIALPHRSLLAVAAVVDVALHARPAPVGAKALAARHGLKPRHLESMLQALVRGGILKGIRGPRGGYELARERRRISVGDIVRAAGRVPEADEARAASRSGLITEVIGPAIRSTGEAFLRELDTITVEDLCARAGMGSSPVTAGDFTI